MSAEVLCKSGDIVLCPSNEYTQPSAQESERCIFSDNRYIVKLAEKSKRCVLPSDKYLVKYTDDSPERVYPSNKYIIETSDDSSVRVYPGDKNIVETTNNAPERVYPGDKYIVETTDDSPERVYPSDKYIIETSDDSSVHVYPGDKYIIVSSDDSPELNPGDKYMTDVTEESQGRIFPGNKYIFESAAADVSGSEFNYLWEESTSDANDLESESHLWVDDTILRDVCSNQKQKINLWTDDTGSTDTSYDGKNTSLLWVKDTKSKNLCSGENTTSNICANNKESKSAYSKEELKLQLWVDDTASTDSWQNMKQKSHLSEDDAASTSSCSSGRKESHLWTYDIESTEYRSEELKLQQWVDDIASTDSCQNEKHKYAQKANEESTDSCSSENLKLELWVNDTESVSFYSNEHLKSCQWEDNSGYTDLCSINNQKPSSVWMGCDSIRHFTDEAFTYPDELEDLRDEDQSLYISDDSSFASPRSYESDCENTNTIGRFATRRLSQTLLNIGICHDETKQVFQIADPSVRMTKHLKTYVSRDYMQSFVTGMVVLEVNSKPVVVVADQINQCVKSFYIDSKNQNHDWLRLCNWPSSITTLKNSKENLVAVNIPFPHHVDILRITPNLQIVHKIKMPKEYFCLASLSKNKVVASSVWEDPPIVDILYLNLNEPVSVTVLRSIVIKKSFLSLCNDPLYLSTNSQGDILLIDWETNGFVCMNQSGTLKFKYVSKTIDQTMQPHSVTCDSSDNIYLSDAEHNRVVLLAKNGEFLRDVLNIEHGLDEPRHVDMDSLGNMYVSQFNGDVKVFSFNPPLVPKRQTIFERMKSCFSK